MILWISFWKRSSWLKCTDFINENCENCMIEQLKKKVKKLEKNY